MTSQNGQARMMLALSTCLSLVTCSLSLAWAVDVDPLRVELTGAAGQTLAGALRVTNGRPEAVRVVAHPSRYRYAFTPRTIPPTDPAQRQLPSCQSWVTLTPDDLLLAPGASGELRYTIAIPADAAKAAAGEYVATILVDEHPQVATPSAEGSGAGHGVVTVTPRIALPLYVILQGRQSPRGRIANFTASPSPALGVTQVLVTVANDGPAHLRPTGNVLVANDRHEVVRRASLGRTIPIFPHYQETIPVWLPLDPGHYVAVATVEVGSGEPLQAECAFTVAGDGQVHVDARG